MKVIVNSEDDESALFLMVFHHKDDGFYLNLSKRYFYQVLAGETTGVPGIYMVDSMHNINNRRSSEKSTFGELRGLHWCWKEKKEKKYKYYGLMQYRRYFLKPRGGVLTFSLFLESKIFNYIRGLTYRFNTPIFKKIITKSERIKGNWLHFGSRDFDRSLTNEISQFNYFVKNNFKNYDFMVAEPRYSVNNLKVEYLSSQNFPEDLVILREIIQKYHSQYLQTFDEVWSSNKLYEHNMFIMKDKYFESYMDWLFDIVFRLEKEMDFENRTSHQQRAIGFISERLLTVFFEHIRKSEKIRFIELPVVLIGSKSKSKSKRKC